VTRNVSGKYPSDWLKRRERVLARDNHECQACEISNERAEEKYGRGLHAHHIDPINNGGGHNVNNLITLCEGCHIQTHRRHTEAPFEAIEWYECAYCGREHSSLEEHKGSFCSKVCVARNRTEKLKNVLMDDGSICSTCFSHFPDGADACPNCGNWAANERNESLLADSTTDWEYILLRISYWIEFSE
jgi:hypothetical protein